MKARCPANPVYSPRKTARRHFGMQNKALRRRALYGRKREKFAGKEPDAETGLYYYGARYLDPKTGRWLSGDPAMGEYFPVAPVNDEAKKHNEKLPGMGGVFNYANLHVYHYAGNNPVKYVDPDGRTNYERRDLLYRSWIDDQYSASRLNSSFKIDFFIPIPIDRRINNIIGKIWALPMTILGLVVGGALHVIGSIMGKGSYITIENNAITFTTGLHLGKLAGSVTFGNVIIHAGGTIDEWYSSSKIDRYDGTGQVNLGWHEEAHTHQYEKYGIFTPFLIIGSAIINGGFRELFSGGGFHGFMGKSKFETEADDYSEIY